jgi:tetratricopeptide (TPR) repeat protein
MKTLKELEQELETQILLHGPRHESVAALHSDIGTHHFNNENYTKALSCYELANDIARDVLGEEHEFVVDTHYRIGRVMEASMATEEKLQAARAHMKENLALRQEYDLIQKRKLNTDEPSIQGVRKLSDDKMDSTMIYQDLAEQARLEGDLDKAQPLYVKSIELRRKKFGDTSAAVSPVLLNYAELLRQKGNYEAAKAVLSEALSINVAAFGKTHANTAEAMNNLGLVLRLLGEYDRAEQALMEGLRIRRGLFGDLNLDVGASLNNVAELYREKQQYQDAIAYHNLAIQAFQAAGGEDHPGLLSSVVLYTVLYCTVLCSALLCYVMFVYSLRHVIIVVAP